MFRQGNASIVKTESYQRLIPNYSEIDIDVFSDDKKYQPSVSSATSYCQSDINFIKFLIEAGVLVHESGNVYQCLGFKKRNETLERHVNFHEIIEKLEQNYNSDKYYDADLEDDVFCHSSIVKPHHAIDEDAMNEHAKKWQLKFKTLDDRNAYYKSRSKMHCLYVFLRRLAILYRDTPFKEPYNKFIDFHQRYEQQNKDVVDLRVDAVTEEGNNWSTGLHEWLMCASFMEAFKRTAGIYPLVDSHLKGVEGIWIREPNSGNININWSEFNWLDYQYLIRTKYEHVLYSNNLEGHTGAVNRDLIPSSRQAGWLTIFTPLPNEPKFNLALTRLFENAKSPTQLILKTYRFYRENILHDEVEHFGTHLNRPGFTVTGVSTTDSSGMEAFMKQVLKKSHDQFKVWVRDLWLQSQLLAIGHQKSIVFTYKDDHLLPLELERLLITANATDDALAATVASLPLLKTPYSDMGSEGDTSTLQLRN